MIRQAVRFEWYKVPDLCYQYITSDHGETRRLSTTGIRVVMFDEDGNGVEMEMGRDDFSQIVANMREAKLDA